MPALVSAVTFAVRPAQWIQLNLKDARQSSESWGGIASRAIDGRSEALFHAASCSHTAGGAEDEQRPWWNAALSVRTTVEAVRVLNRWDCCDSRLDGWQVRVGDDPDPWRNPQCGDSQKVVAAGATRFVLCGLVGSFVGIVMQG